MPTAANLRNVRAFNEYRVVDCGFLYGKNMTATDLVPERVGTTNAQGYAVKRMPAACTPGARCCGTAPPLPPGR